MARESLIAAPTSFDEATILRTLRKLIDTVDALAGFREDPNITDVKLLKAEVENLKFQVDRLNNESA